MFLSRWRGRLASGVVMLAVAIAVPCPAFAQVARMASSSCTSKITERQAMHTASFVPQVALIQSARPQLVMRAKLSATTAGCRWIVVLERVTGGRDIARIEIDAESGAVRSHREAPIGAWPPRISAGRAIEVATQHVKPAAALHASARFDRGTWNVDFRRGDETRIRVEVDDATGAVAHVYRGIQISWPMARGDRYAFGGDANLPWVWIPSLILFALVMIDWPRWRSMYSLDVVAVLAFAIGLEAFSEGRIRLSVVATAVVLGWLAGRMAWLFVHGISPARMSPWPHGRWASIARRPVPTIALILCCVALAGVRIGINVEGSRVVDVGYAGVAGARLLLDHQQPWGNMPADIEHGDTYGPLNYLAYVPAVAAVDDPQSDEWGVSLPAANITTVVADLVCVLLLMLIAWRWLSPRSAALVALGWLTCPFTLWSLESNVNDQLVAAALLAAFASLPRSWLRGLFIAGAGAVKFVPLLALVPALHVGSARRARQSVIMIAGAVAVCIASWTWLASVPHGVSNFVHATFGFQLGRDSPFSVWGMWGWWHAQRAAQVAVVAAIMMAAFVPRQRDAWQVAAGIAAAMFAVQFVLQHFSFLYLTWQIGFVLIVLVAARERARARYAAAP